MRGAVRRGRRQPAGAGADGEELDRLRPGHGLHAADLPRYGAPPAPRDGRVVDWARHAPAIRAEIHRGIDDADYVIALKVLRQLIRNTGGEV
ncbi:hypothetical protein GCM10022221_39660 [Actinocorallia aurea]